MASALASGLYLSRVLAEGRGEVNAWRVLLPLLAGGLVGGALAVVGLRRLGRETWPLILPGLYAAWPVADPRAALMVGVVAAVALLVTLRPGRRLPAFVPELAVAMGAFLLYASTLAPSVQPADAGEFQLVCAVLGIAHPPGYPLYTMLGKLFTLLPFGDPAWRVNLFAAVCAAATLGVLTRAIRQGTDSAAAGVASALALGLSPTFWAQGTFANIRSLTALLTALAMHWLLRYGAGRAQKCLVAFALSFGLAVTHHGSLALLGLPFLAYLLAVDPRLAIEPRRWLRPAAALCGSVAILAYLPLRSAMNPPFDTPSVRTLAGLVDHVLARGFRGDMLYFLGRPEQYARLQVLTNILSLEFGPALWMVALALGTLSLRRDWRWCVLWAGVGVVNALAAITYRAPQTVEYLMPGYVALAYALGLGLGSLPVSKKATPLRAGALGLVVWLVLGNGLAAYPSFVALHRDAPAREQAVELLESAEPGALVLANWHEATPLWYLQLVEGLRPDVTVTYVYPEGATPNGEVWARRIRESVGTRQVLVTNRYAEYASLPYRLVPMGRAWAVEERPAQIDTSGLAGPAEVFDGRIELLGVRIGGESLAPGEAVTLQVVWRARAILERDYSWFVHLVGPQGIAGQADLTYPVGSVAQGELVVDSYRFALRPDSPPGEYRLLVGVYFTFPDGGWQRLRTASGQDAVALGPLHVGLRSTPPVTAHPQRLAWADGSRLVGVDWDDSVPGQRRVYLHWWRPAQAAAVQLSIVSGEASLATACLPGGEGAGYRTVALDLPNVAGALRLEARVDGQVLATLGAWHRPRSGAVWLQSPPPGARYLDLGGEMVLVGARWLPESPRPGAGLAVWLDFVAQRPLVRDYSISVQMEGEGWQIQHDGTPALGAVPTLKWLGGWRVRDARQLEVPATASGPARLRLAVYDAFTLAPLQVGDDRLARLGQGVQAVLWEGLIAPRGGVP